MPHTRHQRALAGQPLSVQASEELSPRSQQLADSQATAQAAYDAGKRYDEETLAAAVVVYDTGRDGTESQFRRLRRRAVHVLQLACESV